MDAARRGYRVAFPAEPVGIGGGPRGGEDPGLRGGAPRGGWGRRAGGEGLAPRGGALRARPARPGVKGGRPRPAGARPGRVGRRALPAGGTVLARPRRTHAVARSPWRLASLADLDCPASLDPGERWASCRPPEVARWPGPGAESV